MHVWQHSFYSRGQRALLDGVCLRPSHQGGLRHQPRGVRALGKCEFLILAVPRNEDANRDR